MKRKNRSFCLSLAIVSLLLQVSSCSGSNNPSIEAYIPAALCLAGIQYSSFNSYTAPFDIEQTKSDIVVAPLVEGIEAIQNNEWPYKLERVIMANNFSLINLETLVTNSNVFATTPLFDSEKTILLNMYGINENQLIETADVRSAELAAQTGEFEGNLLQGIFLQEPYAYISLSGTEKEIIFTKPVTIEYYQYGLFYKEDFERTKKASSVYASIVNTLEDLEIRDANQATISLFSLDNETAIENFGATESVLRKMFLKFDELNMDVGYLSNNPTKQVIGSYLLTNFDIQAQSNSFGTFYN